MRRRRTDEATAMTLEEPIETPATSPETRLRRSKGSNSNPPSARTLRLQPETTLHMTTRAASRAATESAANSVASGDSRRSSLADAPAFDVGSDDEGRPAEKSRHLLKVEEASPNEISDEDDAEPDVNGHEQSSQISQNSDDSPRKRKREQIDVFDSIEATPKNGQSEDDEAQQLQDGSHEEPPAKRAARGKRKGLGLRNIHAPTYTPSDISAVNSPLLPPENGEEPEEPTQGQVPEKPTKRLPGRRRAPHANVNIEADLRRQLSLKMSYRATVKQLKHVLAELATRSIDHIDQDPEAHKRSEHYQSVEDELAERLQSRLDQLRYKQSHAREGSDFLLAAEREVIETNFRNRVRNLQEDYQIRAKCRIMKALRANMAEEDDNATEDECGPIPPIRAPVTKQSNGHVLPSQYDSRSRTFVETDRLWDELAIQRGIAGRRKVLLENNDDPADDEVDLSGFATYNPGEREALEGARKRQALLQAIEVLQLQQTAEDMAAEVESRKTEEGLDILADASERRRLEKTVRQAQQTTPRTPKPAKGPLSRRGSLDDRKHAAEDTISAPPSSSKRRINRQHRSREGSPVNHMTPRQQNANQSENPRTTSNKISDLLNTDQPEQLATITESSPVVTSFPAAILPATDAPSAHVDNRSGLQNTSNNTTHLYSDTFYSENRPGSGKPAARSRSPGGYWGTPGPASRAPTTPNRDSIFIHHVDRRASESAAMRPKIEGPRPAPLPLNYTGSSKPTTFDGSGSTVSPTYARQFSFHNRTSSLGSRPGSYTQEVRDAVVPPQMSTRKEAQRDVHNAAPIDAARTMSPSARHGDDAYYRRSESSMPASRPFHTYPFPYTSQYAAYGGYQPPWQQQQSPRQGASVPQYHGSPSYHSEVQRPHTSQARAHESPPQQQEKDVWRHHPYSRGGRR